MLLHFVVNFFSFCSTNCPSYFLFGKFFQPWSWGKKLFFLFCFSNVRTSTLGNVKKSFTICLKKKNERMFDHTPEGCWILSKKLVLKQKNRKIDKKKRVSDVSALEIAERTKRIWYVHLTVPPQTSN